MKNKFILKMIIIMSIAIQSLFSFNLIASASGVESGNGWKVSYNGQKTDRNTYFANTTDEYSFSSGKSMYVKYPDAKITDTYVELTSDMTAPVVSGNEYEISFYLKGSFGSDTEIFIGERNILLSAFTASGRIDASLVPSGEKNWKKYTYTLSDYTGADASVFKIRIFSNTSGTYIDDVAILNSDGENLITDSSFDGIEGIVEEMKPFDTTNYQTTRMIASSGVGLVGLSWKNPETTGLYKVSVYNITDGGNDLIIDSLSTKPNDIVVYPVTGLTDGKEYIFMVKFDFTNGASFKYYMSGVPGSGTYQGMIGAWTVWKYAGGTATYTPTEINIDNEEFHSGESSMRFILNNDATDDPDLSGNNYIRAFQENLTLDADSVYEIKMWLKCEEFGKFNLMMDWNNLSDGVSGRVVKDFGGTMDWKEYTFHYNTSNGNATYLNMLAETPGIMWIDDVSIYKLDGDGNPIGDNLITDGGFEGFLDTSVGDLNDAYADNIGTNRMTLHWETTSSKVSGVNIYEKLFDNYEYRGTVSKGISSVDVTNLVMGETYSYKLVPVNSMGVEGKGIEITAETEMPEYTIKKPVLKKGSYAVEEVNGVGTYTVTTEVKNYQTESMEFLQCVAVYKDGALEKIYPTECSGENKIPVMQKNQPAQKVNTIFTIEDNGEYSAKVYIFDNIINMNSYIPKTVFE